MNVVVMGAGGFLGRTLTFGAIEQKVVAPAR
jgi:hypothetical protein